MSIFLDTLARMSVTVESGGYRKKIYRDLIGQHFTFTYDACKKMLALCSSTKAWVSLIFILRTNEPFSLNYTFSFSMKRTVLCKPLLASWAYHSGMIRIYQFRMPASLAVAKKCFWSTQALEQEYFLWLQGNFGRSRFRAQWDLLYHWVSRPALLQLQSMPNAVYSSPDGSCLLTSHTNNSMMQFTAYHWSTFGSTPGIQLGSLGLSLAPTSVLTSFHRRQIHLVDLDVVKGQCRSTVLEITRKATDFMFQKKRTKDISYKPTLHNCLVDCHSEVWTRFPVVPAIRRQAVSSSSKRVPKTLTFITDRDHQSFASHFSDMIQTFERTTRKPTGKELSGISISAVSFDTCFGELKRNYGWDITCFRGGEWLVEFFCLIPIHIAITKENRFIPLKDGVLSAELEKSLLGADVGCIVDNLSVGWYESIFQSYMVSKVTSSVTRRSILLNSLRTISLWK